MSNQPISPGIPLQSVQDNVSQLLKDQSLPREAAAEAQHGGGGHGGGHDHGHGDGHGGGQGGGHGEHVFHNDVHPWNRLKYWLRAESRELWVAIIYSAAIGLLSLALPLATQSLVNTIAFGSLLQPIAVLTILLFSFLAFSSVLQTLRAWVVEFIQRRVFVRVASDSVTRLLRARSDAFERHYAPEIVNRFLEVVTVQKSAALLLIDGLSIVMQTLMGMALLAVYHPWLGVLDFFLALGIVTVLFVLGQNGVKTAVQESFAKYELVAWLEEVARHPVAFKSTRGSKFALQRTDSLVKDYLNNRHSHFRVVMRQIVGSLLLQALASSLLLGVGGYLVIARELTLGQLIASELVVALVVSGFSKFGKQLETFYDLMASLDKLGYLTDLPLEKSGREDLPAVARGVEVELRNIRFRYGNKPDLLKNVSWRIPAGGRIGLVANSGSGISTLLDILYGLRTPASGVVEFDGMDSRDTTLSNVRGQIAIVRSAEIFQGTVSENVALDNGSSSAQVREALAAVGLLEEVLHLPDGIHTRLSTYGEPLSPGQALRLTLARAIAGQPRLLVLDECLDLIDDVAERECLLRALFDRTAPWTLIVSSANPDVLSRCERVYALRGGQIEEEGLAARR